MKADIKTAAEAKADALVWQQLLAAPNSIGIKIYALLQQLMEFQRNKPEALSVTVTGQDIVIPTAAIASIQTTWGYVITAQSIPKPANYHGNINQWSKVTKISWE